MTKQVLFFVLLPSLFFSQGRHEKVRQLNAIVNFMDEASRLNQTYYFDAVQLAKALYQSKLKINKNYFYTSQSNSQKVYYTGMEKAFRFKELKPDEKNFLPAYMADLIPYLEGKEKIVSWLKKAHPGFDKSLDAAITSYIIATDSLCYIHNQLADYVATGSYTTDAKFIVAKKILKQSELHFEKCHFASEQLYSAIQHYYLKELPLNKTHAAIQEAEKEMHLLTDLLENWQKELYAGDNSKNRINDSIMRSLNKIGLGKDSLYLYKTKGYGNQNNGWWAHTRYRSFYTMMQSTVYWYAKERYSKEPYLKPEHQHYNKIILSYNMMMEYYNRFIELMDGKTMIKTSSCCLSVSQLDTNQNVMLNKPRLLYQFAYVEPTMNTLEPAHTSTITTEVHSAMLHDTLVHLNDQALIDKALPHHLIYLLDASSSMNEFGRINNLKSSAKYLVKLQRPSDKISIVSFASAAHIILKNNSCNNKDEINAKIEGLEAQGSTNIKQGLIKASQIADSCKIKNGKNKILLITDGAFKVDKPTSKIIKSFKDKDIEFCIIYLGNSQSKYIEEEFKNICKQANGRFYNTNTVNLRSVLVKEASE